MPKLANRVLEIWTGTGNSATITLPNVAEDGHQRWSDAFSSFEEVFYFITNEAADEWEAGLGTIAETGSFWILGRDTVLDGSNGTSRVSFSAGDKKVYSSPPVQGFPGLPIDVQVFTASGTWTKPPGARWVRVRAVGGGGGGGGGGRTSGNHAGGSGGGGGEGPDEWFDADWLSATETVTIGAGGSGGNNVASGNPGTAGGDTTFGGRLRAHGGGGGVSDTTTTTFGGNGGGASSVAQDNSIAGRHEGRSGTKANTTNSSPIIRTGEFGGGAGGPGSISTGSGDAGSLRNRMGGYSVRGGGGGGAGGAGHTISGQLVAGQGGIGTLNIPLPGDVPTGGSTSGGNGANGADATDPFTNGGSGGDGGIGLDGGSGTPGDGGNGGFPGGGGGGGGGRNHTTGGGGLGGDGGDGWCAVISYG